MAVSKGNSTISVDELSFEISETDIAFYYLNISRIPCVISSPLRKDKHPSFGLYTPDGRTVRWKDFATSQGGGIYDLLNIMWHTSLRETINKIVRELPMIKKTYNKVEISSTHSPFQETNTLHHETNLEVKVREWRDYDIEYWESYGVSLPWLKYAEIYPISHKIITTPKGRFILGADKYAYVFVEHKENKVTLKVYQPFNKDGYKWMNKHDKSVVSLWTKVPEHGNQIVICSSIKDALCLWSNTGIPALAVQGEGFGMSDTAIKELKKRFSRVYVLFDNDAPGLKDGKTFSERTGFINVVLPEYLGAKDISDAYKKIGKQEFQKVMLSLFGLQKEPNQTLKNKEGDTPF